MARTRPHATMRDAAAACRSGRLDEAARICQQILKRDKRDFDAFQMLGLIAARQNRYREARSWYDKALRLRPADPEVLFRLGKLAAVQGAFEEAVGWYDRGLAADPRHGGALAGKAEALERQGRFEEARAVLEPVIEAGGEDAETARTYAALLQEAKRHDEAVKLIERHLAATATPDPARRELLFALGKSHGALHAVDAAFDAYRRANELDVQPFDVLAHRRTFDRIIETFTPERIAARPRSSCDSALPVFVVGMPRCGSTLVEQILSAHPAVHGAGEIGDFMELVHGIPAEVRSRRHYPEIVDDLDGPALDRIAHRHVGRLRRRDRTAARIVDKLLANYQLLGLIDMLLPRAHVIHCRRDPMAVCFSIYTLPLSPVALPYSTDLRTLGRYYREYERLMAHWVRVLDLPILEVRYEDLVADHERHIREIVSFCGLAWDDACLRFYETGRNVATASYDQVRRPIYTSATRRYAPYEAHLRPLREALEEGTEGLRD